MTPHESTLFMAEAGVRSFCVALVVAAIIAAFRIRNPRTQLLLWSAVLATSLTMPLLMTLTPPLRLPQNRTVDVLAAPIQVVSSSLPAPDRFDPQNSTPAVPPVSVLAITWLTLSVALLIRLLAGMWSCRRLRRFARAVPDLQLLREFSSSAQRVRLRRLPDVIESPHVAVPLTFGVRKPVVILPSSWREWDADRRTAVISHELSHIARGDFLLQLLAKLHTAIFSFSPLAWWLERKLAALAEEAADDDGIHALGSPAAYAEVVLSFLRVRRSAGRRLRFNGGLAMARTSSAAARINRILDSAAPSVGALSIAKRVGVLAGIIPLALFTAACERAEKQATPVRLIKAAFAQAAETIHGRDGSYVYVQRDQSMMDGTSADRRRAASYRSRYGDRYLWFRRGGNEYVVADEKLLVELDEAMKPQRELGLQQAQLGEEQARLGEQQAKLGEQHATAAVEMPDLTQDVRRLDERVRALKARKISQAEVGDLQGEIGAIQAKIGEIQASLGAVNARLGEKQNELGSVQAELGAKQAILGRRQAEAGAALHAKVQELIEQSLRSGAARRQ
jgi:beta-lactamase regulating signal transducer with metallopeptidase domain